MEKDIEDAFPASIFCIIVYEFCERFSFCGLRTILSLYLRNELLFSENCSTIIYHVFNMGCHAVPLVGAVCADSFLGRYRTIIYFTTVYLIGNALMCVAAVPYLAISRILVCALSLVLVAIGSGALKPCVAAFGGDQFKLPAQQALLRHFFSIFYFTINLGGFVGMILSPILRKWVNCFGEDTCYAMGFGFPAILMGFGLLVLCMGKPWYRVRTPKGPIIAKFMGCCWHALAERNKSKNEEHVKSAGEKRGWLDYAPKDKYDKKWITDMKLVFAILLLYVPLPLFWSLFDQQGSRWTFQASHMDGNVLGIQILPDQMQVLNPVMVLFLIPVFDRLFYPLCDRLNILDNPLHRMAIGGIIAGLAFFAAGILELTVEMHYPKLPERHQTSVNFVNTLPCEVEIKNPFNGQQMIGPGDMWIVGDIDVKNLSTLYVGIDAPNKCGDIELTSAVSHMALGATAGEVHTLLIGTNSKNELHVYMTDPDDLKKSLNGKPRLRIVYMKTSTCLHNVTVTMKSSTFGLQDVYFIHDQPDTHVADSAYMELPAGINECVVGSNEHPKLYEEYFHLDQGGVYSLVFREREEKIEFVKVYTMALPNKVNILWLLPQYILISIAEIMFGIAGLEFSFTQAPKSMKTVTIAGWYLSVSFGNFLVIIITQANFFKSQAQEFFMFAVLIVADMMIFAELASRYRFVKLEADSSVAFIDEEVEAKETFFVRHNLHTIVNFLHINTSFK